MMALFKAIGKFIDKCGLTHMMVESELLASGSVNGFINGQHFNRCKRLHPLVALGLRTLLFEELVKREEITITPDVIGIIKPFLVNKLSDNIIADADLDNLLIKYLEHEEEVLDGKFDKTAQFYAMYINFVHYYLTFIRSIRTGDFQLYKEIIPKLSNCFFVFNQPNY